VAELNKRGVKKHRIFLLVNDDVFSSSGMRAVFSKATGWAMVPGETTSGDGIGSDPIGKP